MRSSPVLCAAALLPACASKETQEIPDGMAVTVTLREVHRCSRISPEIQVAQTPGSTDYYDVRLVEFTSDGQDLFLGGGEWNNDGSGIIPEGGLTRHYRGPCPPAGQSPKLCLYCFSHEQAEYAAPFRAAVPLYLRNNLRSHVFCP